QENISHGDNTVTTLNELDLLFSPMSDELLNGPSQILGSENLADMFTKVVTTEKLKLCAASTDLLNNDKLRLMSYHRERERGYSQFDDKVRAVALLKGRVRAEGFNVVLTKHNEGRTLLTQKLLGILLLSRAEED
nr:hypothetical protein [Tanacetum cinerariifolium]